MYIFKKNQDKKKLPVNFIFLCINRLKPLRHKKKSNFTKVNTVIFFLLCFNNLCFFVYLMYNISCAVHVFLYMSSESKITKKFNIKDYQELIDTLAKVEYKKLSSKHLIDFSELINIGTQVVHKLCSDTPPDKYNRSYISTSIKWAIRNEIRRRYKWYVLKNKNEFAVTEENQNIISEAVYKTILSVEELQEGDNPTQIRDFKRNPEEKILFFELSESIKEAVKNLPQRERDLIEAKFYKDKKLKEISDEFNLSPSRISRIIQSGISKIRKELAKQNLV